MKSIIFCIVLLLDIYYCNAQEPKLILPIGHTGEIQSINFSPDSKYILTTSLDSTAKLWEALSGKLLFSLKEDNNAFNQANFSHDGKFLLTVSENDTTINYGLSSSEKTISSIKLWNSGTGNLIKYLKLANKATYIAFSPDDKNILVESDEGCFSVYEISTLHPVYDLCKGTVTISHNGKFLLTTSQGDSTIKLWNALTGKPFKQFKIGRDAIGLSFSKDDQYILADFLIDLKDYVKAYEIASGNLLYTLEVFHDWEKHAVFSPQGNYILTVHGAVKIWNAVNGAFLDSLKGNRRFTSANFSDDEKYIVTEDDSSAVKIWDALTGNTVRILQNEIQSYIPYNEVNFTFDSRYVIETNKDRFRAKIWEVPGGKLIYDSEDDHVERSGHINVLVTASPDCRYIAATKYDKGKIWNSRSNNFTGLQANAKAPRYFKFSPDSKYIATIYTDSTANVWQLSPGRVLYNIKQEVVNDASFSSDGKIITVSGKDSSVKVWDASNGKLLNTIKGHNVIHSANFSFDGGKIVTGEHGMIRIWRGQTGEFMMKIPTPGITNQIVGFSPDGELIAADAAWDTLYNEHSTTLWNVQGGKPLDTIDIHDEINNYGFHSRQLWDFFPGKNICFSPDSKYLAATHSHASYGAGMEGIGVVNISTGAVKYLPDQHLFNNRIWGNSNKSLDVRFNRDGKYIAAACSEGTIKTWNISTGKETALDLHAPFSVAVFSPDEKYIVTGSDDYTSRIRDAATGKLLYTFIALDSTDYLSQAPSGYYMSSPNAAKLLHYVTKDLKVITFEQLDIKYNRPDKVLEVMGNADTALIQSYRNAYFKRIKRLNIDTTVFREGYSIPEADFTNRDRINNDQENEILQLSIHGVDSLYALDRFNVWINEVPLFGLRGINIRQRNRKSFDTTLSITLSQGDNQIQTSITTVDGTESYRKPLIVRYTSLQPKKEKMYFIGIGINHFADSTHNLSWSVKDIRDLSVKLKDKYKNNIEIDTLFDENVTVSRVIALKKKLENSSINDKVIIAYSGHGLLSRDYDYYLSTYRINFNEPTQNGLPYGEMENLLDSIPARKKLMLIDACQSGEVDKEEMLHYREVEKKLDSSGIKKGVMLINKDSSKVGMKNSFELMRELFVNVGKSTGATIISAAAGTQFALEKDNLKNGVFTYSILEYMNQHHHATVNEIKQYVNQKVTELTSGLQVPTARNENIEFNWEVW